MTECMVCCVEQVCQPCGAANNCSAYICKDCEDQISITSKQQGNGLDFRCPVCTCHQGKKQVLFELWLETEEVEEWEEGDDEPWID